MHGKTQKIYPMLNNTLVTSTKRANKEEGVVWVEGEPFEAVLQFHKIESNINNTRIRIYMLDPATGYIYGFPPVDFEKVMNKLEKGKLKGEFHVVKKGMGYSLTWYDPKLTAAQALAREVKKVKKKQKEARANWIKQRRELRKKLNDKRREAWLKKKEKAAKHKIVVEERNKRRREVRKLQAEQEKALQEETLETVVDNSLD